MFTLHRPSSVRTLPKCVGRFARGSIAALLAALVTLSIAAIAAPPATGDDELKAKVGELVKGLDATKAADRQAAQTKLIELGAEAIAFLPSADAEGLSAEQKRRIAEIRAALGHSAGQSLLKASRITLNAKGITLSDAIAAIQRQSGNQIVDLREDFGQEATNPEFSAEWNDRTFWEVLDEIQSKTMIGFYLHTGERQIGLVMEPPKSLPTAYAGPLRIALKQLVRRISFEDRLKEFVMELEIAWEPRLRPILFEVKPENMEVLDDQSRKIAIEAAPGMRAQEGEEMSLSAAVDSTMILTTIVVRLAQPDKGAEKLKLVRGKLDVLVPAKVQTFEFADIAKAKNVKKQSGNMSVSLERFRELESHLWSAEISLEVDSESEAFESYETWFYDNEAYLQRADGTRFVVNGGYSVNESDGGRVVIEYRFVDAPGKVADYKFIYKTPSSIVRESLPFELRDIELP